MSSIDASGPPLFGLWWLSGVARPGARSPRRPSTAELVEIGPNGAWRRWIAGGVRVGQWTREGDVLEVKEPGFDPLRIRVTDAGLELHALDEEHGGREVATYQRAAPIDLAELTARAKKAKAKAAELGAAEGWIERAFRDGRVELLELALASGCGVYPGMFVHLDECPPDAVASLVARISTQPSVVTGMASTSAAVLRAALATPAIAELAPAILVEIIAKAPPLPARLEAVGALLASVPSADLSDASGIPLIVHATLRAPSSWVDALLARGASSTSACAKDVQVAGDWGRLELRAGTDAKSAGLAAASQVEAEVAAFLEKNPTRERDMAWKRAAAARIRESVARLG